MRRWLLWLACVLLLPVPFFLVQTGLVPAARILMLGLAALAVILAEGAQGMVGLAAALLGVQALFYLAAFWWLAGWGARALARTSPRRAAILTTALIGLSLLVAARFEIYRTPFRTQSLHADWPSVFE